MKKIPISQQSFEDVATATIRLGRALMHAAKETHAGGNSRAADFVSQTLRRIGDRTPFDHRDEGSLEEIHKFVSADLEAETLGTATRFVEVGHDCDGPVIDARDTMILTERGEELVRVLRLLEDFMRARAETLDRAAAERAIRRLTSG